MSMKFYCIFPHNFTINCSEARIGAEGTIRLVSWVSRICFASTTPQILRPLPPPPPLLGTQKSIPHTRALPPHPGKAIYAGKTIFHNGTRGFSALDVCCMCRDCDENQFPFIHANRFVPKRNVFGKLWKYLPLGSRGIESRRESSQWHKIGMLITAGARSFTCWQLPSSIH